jgi:hypothetical protein
MPTTLVWRVDHFICRGLRTRYDNRHRVGDELDIRVTEHHMDTSSVEA